MMSSLSKPIRFGLGISTLRDEGIQYQYYFDVLTLLKQWHQHPLGDLSLAFFRPAPMVSSEELFAPPIFSTKRIVLALSTIFLKYKKTYYPTGTHLTGKNAAEIISCLFNHYLATYHILPSEAMRMVMKRLKGHFALMILLSDGKWLIVAASRGYPLATAKFSTTVYFSTDTNILAHFSPYVMPITSKIEPVIFCATSFQKADIFSPISIPFD